MTAFLPCLPLSGDGNYVNPDARWAYFLFVTILANIIGRSTVFLDHLIGNPYQL
jgi:hypothetical protein